MASPWFIANTVDVLPPSGELVWAICEYPDQPVTVCGMTMRDDADKLAFFSPDELVFISHPIVAWRAA